MRARAVDLDGDPQRRPHECRRREGRYLGVGQTRAAHELANVPDLDEHIEPGVGHYGVFNGPRFRDEIAPRIRDFIAETDAAAKPHKPKTNGARRLARV